MTWRLAHVCRGWRDFLLLGGGTSFWSFIHVGAAEPLVLNSILSEIRSRLHICKKLPLTITYVHDEDNDEKTPLIRPLKRDILRLLLQHAHRWSVVHLRLTVLYLCDLEPARGRFLQLKKLTLDVPRTGNYSLPLTPLTAFDDAPKLKNCALKLLASKDHRFQFGVGLLRLPFSQLHSLFLSQDPGQPAAIDLCPNLKYLGMSKIIRNPNAPQVVHKSLLVLAIDQPDLLLNLSCPQLQILTINGGFEFFTANNWQSLPAFLRRSQLFLRELSFPEFYLADLWEDPSDHFYPLLLDLQEHASRIRFGNEQILGIRGALAPHLEEEFDDQTTLCAIRLSNPRQEIVLHSLLHTLQEIEGYPTFLEKINGLGPMSRIQHITIYKIKSPIHRAFHSYGEYGSSKRNPPDLLLHLLQEKISCSLKDLGLSVPQCLNIREGYLGALDYAPSIC